MVKYKLNLCKSFLLIKLKKNIYTRKFIKHKRTLWNYSGKSIFFHLYLHISLSFPLLYNSMISFCYVHFVLPDVIIFSYLYLIRPKVPFDPKMRRIYFFVVCRYQYYTKKAGNKNIQNLYPFPSTILLYLLLVEFSFESSWLLRKGS